MSVTLERTPDQTEVAAAPEQATSALPEAEQRSSLAWLGYTLIGVGAASAIAWGTSLYMIEFQYNRDEQYKKYRDFYGNRTLDACDAALGNDDAGGKLDAAMLSDFQSRCRTGRTFQTLQWVFLSAAVVSSGIGAFVLISESGKSDRGQARRPKAPRFALDPLIDRRTVALQATLRF